MKRQGRILIVEDEEVWREELFEVLHNNGFYVDVAATAAHALELLNVTFYHVLVLDLRLSAADQNSIDGITLLQQLDKLELNAFMKVIILSAQGTRELLRDTFKDYKEIDFVFKEDFRKRLFLQNMQHFFDKEVKLNLYLTIMWQEVDDPKLFLLDLRINDIHIKQDSALQQLILLELDDLLCRLFYQAQRILVQPLSREKNGSGLLEIQPVYSTGDGHTMIVKLGDYHEIKIEYSRYKQYIDPSNETEHPIIAYEMGRTPHLGGIVYSL